MNNSNKFIVIYSFKIIEGKELYFINAWRELTNFIYESAGSYGSRLHKVDNNSFIAYAQWPDKETWENSSEIISDNANNLRKLMHENCLEIKTEYQMTVIEDYFYDKQYM